MKKEEKIIMDIYRALYKASTPSADFDELMENAALDDSGRKLIPYNDYLISIDTYDEIISSILKDKRLTKLNKSAIRSSIHLGCSPKTIVNL